ATTIFNTWRSNNLGLIPAAEETDDPLPEVGVTFFVRALRLHEDTTPDGWCTVQSLSELMESAHWQVPGSYVDGVLVEDSIAARAPFYVGAVGGRTALHLAEPFTVSFTGASTAVPVVAMAFWYEGTLGGRQRPLI